MEAVIVSESSDPGPSPAKRANPKRLIGLVSVLVIVAVFAGWHVWRVARYTRQLVRIGHELVEEENRNDPRPMPAEGPEADVEVSASCTFAYLVFGSVTGKVTLTIKPRPHAPYTRIGGVAYEYRRVDGAWESTESYHL